MNAFHITNRENFDAIHRDGFIRPQCQTRQVGEYDIGFGGDWHSPDNQYVCFAPLDHAEYYMHVSDPSDCWGFVFDAEFLVLELNGLVGTDLSRVHWELMYECAEAIATQLGPKSIDEASLQAYLDQHQITDAEMIASIRKSEGSYYQDVLDGMLDADDSVLGAMDGLKMFNAKLGEIERENRSSGEEALALLRAEPIPIALEILVPCAVPINARLGIIATCSSGVVHHLIHQ